MDSHLEVIDAFVDGERVDTAALKHALADAAGRDYFVDLWMLREAVQQDRDAAAADRTTVTTRVIGTAARWAIAASIVVSLAGGYLAGHRMSLAVAPVEAPPSTSAVPVSAEFPAPAPTRTIQLEFQLDNPRSGGD